MSYSDQRTPLSPRIHLDPCPHLKNGTALALSSDDVRTRQTGFTLIELMIVVAIIGILSAAAVYAYSLVTREARVKAEVNAIFAEFKLRQEEFHAENGNYVASPDFPAPIPAGTTVDIYDAGLPAEWLSLRMNPTLTELRCTYRSEAGNAATAPAGAVEGFAGPAFPESNWYYVVAECDTDGQGAPNARYLVRSDIEGTATQDEGL